jgi:hypothetical protein
MVYVFVTANLLVMSWFYSKDVDKNKPLLPISILCLASLVIPYNISKLCQSKPVPRMRNLPKTRQNFTPVRFFVSSHFRSSEAFHLRKACPYVFLEKPNESVPFVCGAALVLFLCCDRPISRSQRFYLTTIVRMTLHGEEFRNQ